ncbi:SigE family RNA polymerase sigma factor [Kineococcus rhizosphaerae]|uniref:RNA polymerase sigma-70 factor (Sigma-E family) n=1 Tax=Kineococcus rhizosphaerae TaxID=559628 RepID=A0A2T0QYS0_9ACTN|nr:SigE family RNA polymerase sigma factor [Kineococcus rhizosphaerae]PRY11508.1 RNA polymerase sigma-70 factor (sigma-E family) [Kineococcus rhizosphaerae]
MRDAEREERFTGWARDATPRLLRIGRLLTGDDHAGEDLVQEVLARIYVRWNRVDQPDAYARRALANAVTSRWRRSDRRHEVPRDLAEDDVGADPSHPLTDVVDRLDLLAALRALPAGQRAVVVLRHLDGCTEEETADLLDVSIGTVKSQNARALSRLRRRPELVQGRDRRG